MSSERACYGLFANWAVRLPSSRNVTLANGLVQLPTIASESCPWLRVEVERGWIVWR